MEIFKPIDELREKFEKGVEELKHHPETIIKLSPTGQLIQGLKNVEKGIKRNFKLPEFKLPKLPEIKLPKLEDIKLPKIDIPKIDLPRLGLPDLGKIKEYAVKYGIPIAGGIIGLIILFKLIPFIFARKTASKYIG